MAGLVPAIHALGPSGKLVDARDKPGHDDRETFILATFPARVPGRMVYNALRSQ